MYYSSSTECLKTQYKIFLKTLRILNYNRFPYSRWLCNWLNRATNWEKESECLPFTWRLLPVLFCFIIWVLFLNGSLQRRNLQITAKLDGYTIYSTLPLLSAHEHLDIYLQFGMWRDYHVFLITTLVFTRLLLDMRFTTLLNYHLIDWLIDWWCNVCLFTW